jgi:hypothetical protein
MGEEGESYLAYVGLSRRRTGLGEFQKDPAKRVGTIGVATIRYGWLISYAESVDVLPVILCYEKFKEEF